MHGEVTATTGTGSVAWVCLSVCKMLFQWKHISGVGPSSHLLDGCQYPATYGKGQFGENGAAQSKWREYSMWHQSSKTSQTTKLHVVEVTPVGPPNVCSLWQNILPEFTNSYTNVFKPDTVNSNNKFQIELGSQLSTHMH